MKKPTLYHPAEERINTLTHLLGAVLAPPGVVLLLYLALPGATPAATLIRVAAVLFYGAALFAVFAGSAVYHFTNAPERRARLRVLDHCAIYFLISGTYAPIMLIGVGGAAGWGVFAFVAVCGAVGVALKLWDISRFSKTAVVLALLMGWSCFAILGELIAALPGWALVWLITGGVLYTVGVLFYLMRWRFSHAVWHFFVLGGAGCQFVALCQIV